MASERGRADIRQVHDAWQRHRLPAMQANPARLVFVDETSVKTNMTLIRGCIPKGARLVAEAPSGRWNTQTFIVGLRCHELVAPFVINGAMDGDIFETYVRTQLAPCSTKAMSLRARTDRRSTSSRLAMFS
uniref:Transposase n=1 Tax=Ochrobactrum sp. LM19 TaxID=1449781 RepID=A0A0D5A159_9HYPH|nr:transposase [Ochrobactrum sp. LM19]